MFHRPTLLLIALLAVVRCAPLAAEEEKRPSLKALIVTAADEQIEAEIVGLADGQLQLATDPPRTVPLDEVARVDITELVSTASGGNLNWVGQDNRDLVQVGSASGGNGIQDIHLHARNLRPVNLKQVLVVCRFPGQLRVWRLDTSQSPHWRVAVDRDALAAEAELYIEPGSIDSFGQKFDVTYTYADGITAKESVVAGTRTSDKLKLNAQPQDVAAAGVAVSPEEAVASTVLAGGDALRGKLQNMTAESLTLDKGWKTDVDIPLLRVKGVWFGNAAPAGAEAEYRQQLAAPVGKDVVLVRAPDDTTARIEVSLRGLDDEQLTVNFQGQDRQINRSRVLGIVLAAHPPLESPAGVVQVFRLASGDVLTGRWVGLADGVYEIETFWDSHLRVPAERVAQIRVRGGKVTSLADLEPIGVEETPYFGRVVPWARDGGPAQLKGKQPIRAIAMHSRCVLTYDLEGQYEKFRATLGFDDSAGSLGQVDCQVLVDGRQQFDQRGFRAADEPVSVEVDLTGARQMALLVDFGGGQDVGDRILWAEPRLFRAEQP